MTPLHKRPIPDGFQLAWDETTWNVGFVFIWSEPVKQFGTGGSITIKPNESLCTAYRNVFGEDIPPHVEIFFSATHCKQSAN
jgi:hypothetical protein